MRRAVAGEAIYRDGVLAAGQPLVAMREPDLQMQGADAACVNCHRRSGLGMKEGQSSVPPISGRYLFQPRATAGDDLDLPFVEGMRADRDPYTDATLARAIRDGIAADGKPLNYLMPHYALGDQDMAALIDYLKGMTPLPVPGVSETRAGLRDHHYPRRGSGETPGHARCDHAVLSPTRTPWSRPKARGCGQRNA